MKIVLALGGNALGDTPERQKEMASITAKLLIPIMRDGHELVITHGNGPQVGLINLAFLTSNKINEKISLMPLSECGAMSEGYIGYHLLNAIENELKVSGIKKEVVSIVTRVEVKKDDPAFLNPTKPIGPFYTKEEALKLPYTVKEDAGRGYRRVIASPKPYKVVEEKAISDLISKGYIVICVGGGGVPVINNNGIYEGIDAVIDKDYASCRLADDINADCLLILTAVSNASLYFNTDKEVKLSNISVNKMKEYNNEGHFLSGSMKPKVEAAINFIGNNKNRIAIITSIENAYEAIKGTKGTRIYYDED